MTDVWLIQNGVTKPHVALRGKKTEERKAWRSQERKTKKKKKSREEEEKRKKG